MILKYELLSYILSLAMIILNDGIKGTMFKTSDCENHNCQPYKLFLCFRAEGPVDLNSGLCQGKHLITTRTLSEVCTENNMCLLACTQLKYC